MNFIPNKSYTREDVWKLYHPNEGEMPDGGTWATGYTREGNEILAFMNIGVAGKTGHDYANSYNKETREVTWFGKNKSHSKQPTFVKLLNGTYKLHLFARWNSKNVQFTYLGVGHITNYQDGHRNKDDITAIRISALVNNTDQTNDPKLPSYGQKVSMIVNKYERDPVKREACINHFGYTCQICGFCFEKYYGILGKEFCEVHHIEPLSEVGGEHDIDPKKDLIPVCSNCHSMLHKRKPALKPNDLISLIAHLRSKVC
jgi:5-methylcytosine-specific restriction protein A